MSRGRFFILAVLLAAPVVILIGFGLFYLWQSGLAFWVWWPLSGFLVAAYILAWRWQKKQKLLPGEPPPPLHWTEQDRQAWHVVEKKAEQLKSLHPDQFTDLQQYLKTAEELAKELTDFYHPNAQDPIAALTIPEILAVVELAAHDLGGMVDDYLPGGHLLTIQDMRRVKQMADWYPTLSNIGWLIGGVFSPVNTAVRYLASQAGMSVPWRLLQSNMLVWFFTAYVHRLGGYLIELNSGRLRVGAKRYLELQKAGQKHGEVPDAEAADGVRVVSFALVGQVKAGKSSLINALLGEKKAITDVVPATDSITRYELHPEGMSQRLQLLDSVGYGHEGPRQDKLRDTESAARGCDAIFLVLHARNPARQADLRMLEELTSYFRKHLDLQVPPIVAILTHIDLLSPTLEWAPRYDWKNPKRLKEEQISEAVAAVKEQLGSYLTAVVPVCTAADKTYGINEWLLPALTEILDQAHAVAFLRCLKAERDGGKIRKLFQQLLGVAKELGPILLSPHAAEEKQKTESKNPFSRSRS
jgi:uncharacterized protein